MINVEKMLENPLQYIQDIKQNRMFDIFFHPTIAELQEMNIDDDFVQWDTDQDNPHHEFTIFMHTFKVLESILSLHKRTEGETLYQVFVFSALLHDIAKRYRPLQGKNKEGRTNYHGHEYLSARIAKRIMKRMRIEQSIIDQTEVLIKYHLLPHQLVREINITDKAIKNFKTKVGENYRNLIVLAIADSMGKKSNQDFDEVSAPYYKLQQKIQGE